MCLACQKPTRSLRHRIRFGQGRKGRQRQRNSDQERQGEYLHYLHYLHYLIIEFVVSFQVRMELGIADHVWQQTRATISLTVDSLSDDFRPLIRAGWLAYINKTCIMFINYIICIIVLICVICIICIRRNVDVDSFGSAAIRRSAITRASWHITTAPPTPLHPTYALLISGGPPQPPRARAGGAGRWSDG